MNQFLNRFIFCFIFFTVITPSIWGQAWVLPSANNGLPVESVVSQSPTVIRVATVVSAVTSMMAPVITTVETPLITAKPSSTNTSLQMPEVVTTANRLDTPLNDLPNSVTVITAKDFEQKQAKTVLDALEDVPGLDITQTGQPGQVSSIHVRGSNDEHTLVMIDGIPLNDPDSTARSYDYLDQLSLDNVSKIEVVRGPQSTLYGSNAMAGGVNIITQEGTGPSGGSALFESGSYGTFLGQAAAQGSDSKGHYSISTSNFSTAGFPSADKSLGNSFNNSDNNFSSALKLGVSPESNFNQDILVRYNQSRTSLDDGGGAGMDDPNYWVSQQQVLVASETQWKLDSWKQLLTVSFVDSYRDFTDMADTAYPNASTSHLTYDGQTAQITWQNNLRFGSEETLVFGLQGSEEWSNETSDYGSATPAVLNNQLVGSSFLESQTNLDERLFLNLGGRLDDYNTYGTHATYQGGVAYLLPLLETKLKATYGTGFLAPTLYQLYATAPTGNPNLQPESSTAYDFGLEQPLGKEFALIGATYFHNDFDNLISYVGNYPTGQYMNSGAFQTQGVEAFLDFKGVKGLSVRGSYTHTDVLTDIPATQANSPLFLKPTDKAGLDVNCHFGPIEVGVWGDYVTQRTDFDFTTYSPVTLNDYVLLNFRASYQVDEHVQLFGRVINILNQYYEEVYG